MNKYTTDAKNHLESNSLKLVYLSGTEICSSNISGVMNLVLLVCDNKSMKGFYCADKVVGKAAAFMYAILKPEELYAGVLSEKAEKVLQKYGIKYFYGEKVPAIINRSGDGFCPMESATKEAETPEEAFSILTEKLRIKPAKNNSIRVEVPILKFKTINNS